MRTPTILTLLLTLLFSLASAQTQQQLLQEPRSITIHTWPLSASSPRPLAEITYASTSATLTSYTPPSTLPTTTEEIVRVGFYHASGAWSGIATSASNFAADKLGKVVLHVNGAGEVYHLGFHATAVGGNGGGEALKVEVLPIQAGPTVVLNKPVVLGPDGGAAEKEPEKSFFQKYVLCLPLTFYLSTFLLSPCGGGAWNWKIWGVLCVSRFLLLLVFFYSSGFG